MFNFLQLTKNLKKERFPGKRGFTLIELLVVIAIISLLSSVVLASLSNARARARDIRRVNDLKQIQTALEMFYSDHGYYPRYQDGDGYDTSTTNTPGCGHVDRWCKLADDLKPYISPLPREPLGATTDYYYYYHSPHDSDHLYGLYAILETSENLAKEDGGYYPSAGSSVVRYEVGPSVSYCMAKYDGTAAEWAYTSGTKICAGGN